MKDNRAPLSTLVAIISGGIVLLTYIFPNMSGLQTTILDGAILAAAAALLVGVVNLFSVHLRKLRGGAGNPLYSLILIGSMLLTFGLTVFDDAYSQWFIEAIQIPVETSLMAVMAVTLTYASTRLLANRANIYSIIFIVFVLIALVTTTPLFGVIQFSSGETTRILASAGARGVLIGVGLGTVTTGLRILFGSDRPYGG